MKKKLSFFAAIGLSLALTTSAFAVAFNDIGNSYAKNKILALSDAGVINGYPDGTFKPTKGITRDEFAKMICVALELPQYPKGAEKFTDVENWARGYVGTLIKTGTLKGYSDTKFGGKDSLSREQMATIFVRLLFVETLASEAYEEGDIPCNFGDQAQIDNYAKAHVALAQHIGLIKGDGTNFYPDAKAERQAVARVLYEFLNARYDYEAAARQLTDNLDEESKEVVAKALEQWIFCQALIDIDLGR